MRWLTMGLAALMVAGFTIVGATQPAPHPEELLAVSDKPYEMAVEAADEGEAVEVEEEETYQNEQIGGVETYYAPTWYESDDEDAEAEAKEWIAFRESGGDSNSRNGQYIGRYQLSEDKLGGDWSEENQEATADAYVAERYGSWSAARDFWERNGWY